MAAQVPEDWTCACLYAWKDVSDPFTSTMEWPGIPMTEVEKHMFCTYMNPDMENVIIHDGNGTYSFQFSLKAGTYYLRVNSGTGQETQGNTAQDYCLTVPVDGDVTVHFDGTTIVCDTAAEEHPEEPEKKQEETPSGSSWIVIGMVGGAVLAVAIVMIILVVRKKKTALQGE